MPGDRCRQLKHECTGSNIRLFRAYHLANVVLQVFQVLSSVNARLEQAAAAHPSRLQGNLPSSLGPGHSPGTPASQPPGCSWPTGSGSRDTLVKLLQQLTDSVVGLIEGLAVEKECLESQMVEAHQEARQLRRQVRMEGCLRRPGVVCLLALLVPFGGLLLLPWRCCP